MSLADSPPDDRETRVNLAIYDFHEAVDRGEPVHPSQWIERFPDLREDLESYFAALGLLTRLLGKSEADPDATLSLVSGRLNDAAGAVPDCRPGELLGDFVLIEKLGEGGQGVVWKASPKHSPEILVALKTLRGRSLNDPDSIRRLREDAGAIARMRHEHIIKVSYFGEDRGRWFFVLELIEGGTVNDRLEDYRVDPRSAAEVIMKIARAVHHAHTRNPGVLHLDLKPGNILLTAEGEPKVTDFGLSARSTLVVPEPEGESPSGEPATPRNVTETLARAGIVGTVPYMSPEMAAGRWSEISTASDVYGLGAVLYAMLAGRAPFRGETVSQTLDLVRAGGPVSPREFNRHVDAELAAICMKCLKQDPEDRYGSADALANDLRRYLEHRPTLAGGRSSVGRELRFWVRRHPWQPIAAAIFLVLAWGLGLAGRVSDLRAENARDAARLAHQVDRELRLIRRAARIMASDPRLEDALTKYNAPGQAARRREAIEDFLDTAVEKEDLFGIAGENPLVNVFVLAPSGVLLADTLDRSTSVGKNFRVRDYFKAFLDEDRSADYVHVATSFLSVKDRRQKIGVSTRIWSEQGEFLGILVANLTIGTRLIDVDIQQEPHDAAILSPLDRSDPDSGTEDLGRPRPYVSILDQRYTPDWKGTPFPAEVMGLEKFQEDPTLDQLRAGIQWGRIVDCHRVGTSQLIAVTRRDCPWPLSWVRFFH